MSLTGKTSIASPDVFDNGCLRVEYDKYYVACAGRPLYNLTLKEFRVLSRLVREIGRPVPPQALWISGWGEGGEFDKHAGKLLKVHISTLRRKLKPFGLNIISKPSIGYILSTADCVCSVIDAQGSAQTEQDIAIY
jgi:DNA-binding response OmpR family regulator